MDKVLIIDDEQEMQELVSRLLQNEQIEVESLSRGEETMPLLKQKNFDLLLLDLHLDNMDGFDLLRDIRAAYPALPVLILSARIESYNKVLGFGLGADDYITKPFNSEEFIARIKGNIRRSRIKKNIEQGNRGDILTCACFRLDRRQYVLYKRDKKIEISSRLIKLITFFMENPDRVFTKEQIYNHVWDDGFFDEQTVIVYIRKLRQAIEAESSNPSYLTTVRGIGYQFNSAEEQ